VLNSWETTVKGLVINLNFFSGSTSKKKFQVGEGSTKILVKEIISLRRSF